MIVFFWEGREGVAQGLWVVDPDPYPIKGPLPLKKTCWGALASRYLTKLQKLMVARNFGGIGGHALSQVHLFSFATYIGQAKSWCDGQIAFVAWPPK